jgi:hypothetical protein
MRPEVLQLPGHGIIALWPESLVRKFPPGNYRNTLLLLLRTDIDCVSCGAKGSPETQAICYPPSIFHSVKGGTSSQDLARQLDSRKPFGSYECQPIRLVVNPTESRPQADREMTSPRRRVGGPHARPASRCAAVLVYAIRSSGMWRYGRAGGRVGE